MLIAVLCGYLNGINPAVPIEITLSNCIATRGHLKKAAL